MKHIMLVEDEVELAQLVRDYLEAAGFEVSMFHDGQDAYTHFQQRKPSLMILDLMVPRMDGLTICRKVREQSDLPIIMVTARTEEIDRVLGLNMGADDYICKPFSPRELVARLKSVWRREQIFSQHLKEADKAFLEKYAKGLVTQKEVFDYAKKELLKK